MTARRRPLHRLSAMRTGWQRCGAWAALWLAAAAGCDKTPAEIIEERKWLQVHTTNAQGYLDRGKLDSAIQQAHRALAIDDEYPKAKLILGNAQYLQAQALADADARAEALQEAEDTLKAVTREAKKSDVAVFKAYFSLGELYRYRWLTALRESVRLERAGGSRADVDAYADEADTMLDYSVRYYQNALLTSRERFDAARARLVETLVQRGRRNPAGKDFDDALVQADLYLQKAQTDEQVVREKRAGIPKRPGLSEQQRLMAYQEADTRLKELHFNIVRMRKEMASIHARRGAWTLAAEELERAIAEEPDYSLLYYDHGLALAKADEPVRAHSQMARYLDMRLAARRKLIEERETLLLQGGNAARDRAKRIGELLQGIDEDRHRVPMALALLDLRLGRLRDAADQLDRVLVDRPDSPAATLLTVTHCIEKGELSRADHLLTNVFESGVRQKYPTMHEVLEFAKQLRRSLASRRG